MFTRSALLQVTSRRAPFSRSFSVSSSSSVSPCSLADRLFEQQYVDLVLSDTDLAPARDGGFLKAVGSGDRGCGLVYRAGRLAGTPRPVSSGGFDEDDFVLSAVKDLRVVKVQSPLGPSNSNNAR